MGFGGQEKTTNLNLTLGVASRPAILSRLNHPFSKGLWTRNRLAQAAMSGGSRQRPKILRRQHTPLFPPNGLALTAGGRRSLSCQGL